MRITAYHHFVKFKNLNWDAESDAFVTEFNRILIRFLQIDIKMRILDNINVTLNIPSFDRDFSALHQQVCSRISERNNLTVEINLISAKNLDCFLEEVVHDLNGTTDVPKNTEVPSEVFFRQDGLPCDLSGLFKNAAIFLICNGPSLRLVEPALLRKPGILTMGVNNGGHYFKPNFWVGVDSPHSFMRSIFENPAIMKFVPFSNMREHVSSCGIKRRARLRVLDYANTVGFRINQKFDRKNWLTEVSVNLGNHELYGGPKSVILAALKIIYLLGFTHVYLVGCDFAMHRDHPYWFSERVSQSYVKGNNTSYGKLRRILSELNQVFEEAGFRVYNTNRKSELHVFPYRALECAIRSHSMEKTTGT